MGRQLSGKAGQTRGFYFFQALFSQVNTSSLPCYDMESAGWLNLSCVVSRDVQTHSFMTKTLKCRVFCDYQQVTQCFAQIKHLAACSRVKLGKAVKEGSKLIKLYRAQPPSNEIPLDLLPLLLLQHPCSQFTPSPASWFTVARTSWPCRISKCTRVCVRETLAGGVRRFHAVSDAFVYNKSCWCVCSVTVSPMARFMENGGVVFHTGFTVCVCVVVFSVRTHNGRTWVWVVDCLGLQWQLERTNTMSLYQHHYHHPPLSLRCFSKLHALCSWTDCKPPSLPSSTPYYITLSLAMFCTDPVATI